MGSEEIPRDRDRQIVVTQMNAVGVRRDRDVDAVVDHEGNPFSSAEFA